MDIINYVLSFNRNDYQKDNFDSFLKAIRFSFDIPVIHIAGTNGKGSTALYIKNIYKKAGLKVGLFMSPFFYSFKEMVTVNDTEITDNEIESIINPYKKQIEKYDLSSFEIQTFLAYKHFQNQNVDIAIIECGMGGEIDATNIVENELSIITSISLEHTSFLGRTISEIALQKAGILTPGKRALIGDLNEEAINVISSICRSDRISLKSVNKFANENLKNNELLFTYLPFVELKIKSIADYSIKDACLAIEAVQIMKDKFPVSEENIRDGLYDINIPFRAEIISDKPTVIIDGGHNPEAIENLSKCIEIYAQNRVIHVIFACFRDKNIQRMLDSLSLLSSDVTLTTFDHPRARTEEEYFLFGADYQFNPDYMAAIKEKMSQYPDDIILVTGSLAFVSFVKKDFFAQ